MNELRPAPTPPPKPEDPGRLAPDQPVWEVGGDQRGAEGERPRTPERLPQTPERLPQPAGARQPAPARRWGSGWSLLAVALALGMFAGGIAVGSALARKPARLAPLAAAPATSAVATTAAPTTAPARQVAPQACLSAVDDADAVISYLVANVRDQRLAQTMQQYRAASGNCRRAR